MTDTQAGSPLAGSDPGQVGPYRLLRRLGSGTMGRVYLAIDAESADAPDTRPVALKLIHSHLAEQEVFRRRFAHELAAMRQISSEHTAGLLDADSDAGQPWFVSAYVPGPSMEAAVAERGPLPVREVAAIGAGIIEGLRAIHAAGIVHRDLKPANILLGPAGPVIIDFGIARAADATHLTATGVHVGTFEFMSPEQVSGGFVGPSSDTFALGSVLFYAATGQRPFTAATTPAICQLILSAPPPPEVAEMIAPGLRATILSCLAKDPYARPSLDQVAKSLALIAAHGDAAAPPRAAAPTELAPGRVRPATAGAPAPSVRRWRRPGSILRSRIAWAGLAVILAIAATTAMAIRGVGLDRPAALHGSSTTPTSSSTHVPLPTPVQSSAPVPSSTHVPSSPSATAAKSSPSASAKRGTTGGASQADAGGQTSSPASGPGVNQPTRQSAPPPTPVARPAAQPATLLGAPDFNGYCRATGQGGVTLVSADYAYGWHCTSPTSTGDDAEAVCEWTYNLSASQVTNRVADFYNPSTWQCWRITRQVSPPDWNGYCQTTGHGAVSLARSDAYGWYCADGSAIDADAACEWTNGTTPEVGRFQDFYDPNSWQCWR